MTGGDLDALLDKRKQPRANAIYAITFEQFIGSRKLGQGFAKSVNISGRGLMFETTVPLATNDTVIVWLTGPQYTLHARGIVVHSSHVDQGIWRVGVRLDEMIEGDWRVLEHDVERLLRVKPGRWQA